MRCFGMFVRARPAQAAYLLLTVKFYYNKESEICEIFNLRHHGSNIHQPFAIVISPTFASCSVMQQLVFTDKNRIEWDVVRQ